MRATNQAQLKTKGLGLMLDVNFAQGLNHKWTYEGIYRMLHRPNLVWL